MRRNVLSLLELGTFPPSRMGVFKKKKTKPHSGQKQNTHSETLLRQNKKKKNLLRCIFSRTTQFDKKKAAFLIKTSNKQTFCVLNKTTTKT